MLSHYSAVPPPDQQRETWRSDQRGPGMHRSHSSQNFGRDGGYGGGGGFILSLPSLAKGEGGWDCSYGGGRGGGGYGGGSGGYGGQGNGSYSQSPQGYYSG